MQFIRKNLLQTLLVTRRAGSSDYTVGVGVAIALLLVGNIVAVCLGVESLQALTERVRAVFHVNLVPLYMGTRAPFFADMVFGLTLRQHGLVHRALGWICLLEGLGYTLLSLASEQWTVRSHSFGVRRHILFCHCQPANNKRIDRCRYGRHGCHVNLIHPSLGIRTLPKTPSRDQCWDRGLLVASDDQPI